ncbi:hypothetical protein ACWEBX_08100 [Streptomyces sp. NPDC005070]
MPLLLDDFSTGPESFSVPPGTIETHFQAGSMLGGARSIKLHNSASPKGTPARLDVGGQRLLLTLDADQWARLDVTYGIKADGVSDLGLNLHEGGLSADRIRVTISRLDDTAVNFNLLIGTPSGWTSAGKNAYEGKTDFLFSEFAGPAGQDFTHVRYIVFTFTVKGSLRLDSLGTPEIGGSPSLVASPAELGGSSAPVDSASTLANVDNHLNFDRKRGWIPQLAGNSTPVDVVSSLPSYTFADWERYLQIAVSHPDVREILSDGFVWLGCHLLTARGVEAPVQVLVALRRPTSAQVVEVAISGETVVSVTLKEPWEHPESPTEMATAIDLIASHPDYGPIVAGLTGHAILRVPNAPHEHSNGHRCLNVMFTESDDQFVERLVCFSALVDIQTRQLIATRKSPCAEATRGPQ